jgi:TRAP-type C4-dicarboxylate transport system permease large subunit
MKRTIVLLIALSAFIFSGACKEKEDTSSRDMAILMALAASQPGGFASQLNPQQQQSTAAAAAAGSAAGSAAGASGVNATAHKFGDRDRLFAAFSRTARTPSLPVRP